MKIVTLLGGNLGDSKALFQEAIHLMKSKGFIIENFSKVYKSIAWGYTSKNIYLNQVIVFQSNDSPQHILSTCLSIEKELGRQRVEKEGYSDRPIDIDILYMDDLSINKEELTIPHPRLHLRRFTLVPLEEILPDFIHPILKKDHKSLLLLCPDKSKVEAVD